MTRKEQCPRCGWSKFWNIRRQRQRCARCRHDWTPPPPLRLSQDQWTSLLEQHLLRRSAPDIAKETGLRRERILRALELLRARLSQAVPAELDGAVGSNGSGHGAGQGLKGSGLSVLGVLCGQGQVWARVADLPRARTFLHRVRRNGTRDAVVCSDLFEKPIGPSGGFRVRHLVCGANGGPSGGRALNGLEGFWSYLAKHWRGARPGNHPRRLSLHLAEHVWRYNNRFLPLKQRVHRLVRLLSKPSSGNGSSLAGTPARAALAAACLALGSAAWSQQARYNQEPKAWSLLVQVQGTVPSAKTLQLLQRFLHAFPQGERSADATFAMAEILFRSERHSEAAVHYRALIDSKHEVYMGDALLRMGELHYNLGQFQKARDFWERLEDRASRHSILGAEALYGLTLCALREKNFLIANQLAERMIARHPSYGHLPKVRELVGMLRFQEKDYAAALEALSGIDTPVAAFYRGLGHFNNRQYQEAAESFSALSGMPAHAYAELGAFLKAECFRMVQNDSLASTAYGQFLADYPASRFTAYAMVRQADALIRMGELDSASAKLERAKREEAPKEVHIDALYLEARIAATRGDYKRAMEIPRQALRLVGQDQPDVYARILTAVGYYSLKAGREQESAAAMQEMLSRIPHHPMGVVAHILLGRQAYHRRDWKTAITAYETALLKYNYSPLSDVAMAMMLAAYSQSHKNQELVTHANRVIDVVSSEFSAQNIQWRSYSHYLLAEAYYRLKLYADASKQYEQALKEPLLADHARLSLAWSLYHEGRYVPAVHMAQQVLGRASSQESQRSSAQFLLAACYFNQKNFDAAIEAFHNFRARFPRDSKVPESWLQEGWAQHQGGYFADALDAWRSLVRLFPDNALAQEAQMRTGRLYFQARQYANAVAAFSKLMARWPESSLVAESQWMIAQSYYNWRKDAPAIKAYEQFLADFPKDDRATDAQNQLRLARYRQASQSKDPGLLARFVQLYPKSEQASQAQYLLAQIAYERKDWAAAASEFRRHLLLFPGASQAPSALLAIAHAQEYLKKPEAAIAEYKSLLTLFPNSPIAVDAAMRLGAMYYGVGEYKGSAETFRFVMERDASKEIKANALYNIAVATKKQRSYAESIEAFDLFAGTYPEDPKQTDALLEIASIYRLIEQPENALAAHQRLLEKQELPGDLRLDIHNQMGEIHASAGDTEKAIASYSQLLALGPAGRDARLLGLAQLAALYEGGEAWDKALAVYEQIQRSGGKREWVHSAAVRAKEIREYLRAQKRSSAPVAGMPERPTLAARQPEAPGDEGREASKP